MATFDYSNLKDKTIFDFTDDVELLKKTFPNYNESNKELIIAELKRESDANGFYLWGLADYTNNKDLLHAVKAQFNMAEVYGYDPD